MKKKLELNQSEKRTLSDILQIEYQVLPELRKLNYLYGKIQEDKKSFEGYLLKKMEADPQKYKIKISNDLSSVELEDVPNKEESK